jgi:hypothetical protein
MVEPSDDGDLMSKFLSLPLPWMFMYGHFPMYSNPVAMWRRIAEFQNSGSDAR